MTAERSNADMTHATADVATEARRWRETQRMTPAGARGLARQYALSSPAVSDFFLDVADWLANNPE
jgi:hypothetical protein